MKKLFLCGLASFLLSFSLVAQAPFQGKVLEGLSIESKILGTTVNYSIYLPPDYATSTRSYPVVYLLHGYTDNETAWVQFGEVNAAADRGIENGDVAPAIIVMPDGGVTFYINDYAGKVRWEDMFIEEFIPDIESKYRIRSKKEFRGISGLSMGGYGSTILAMRHPDMFAACAAFSSAYRSEEEVLEMSQQNYNRMYANLFGPDLTGEDRLTDHWKSYNTLHQAENMPVEELNKVRWYIDCGDDDFLYKGNSMMHIILKEREVNHEYRVRDGAHNWEYWRTGIYAGLKFISQSFHR
ncbi:MAG: alpha/beta hydrolase [Cyclobacteriaceae bacterium]